MDNINQQQDQDSGNKSSSYLCRQSSTRWTPTSDQIRILKELYYNNGIRSPTADQIQRIAARLRHYGKIEGKNVFYWFQNHKARERQKKRFTPAPQPPPATTATTTTTVVLPSHFSDHHHHLPSYFYNHQQLKLNATHHVAVPPEGGSSSSSSSQAFIPVSYGYGSISMENSFRECSISPVENTVAGGDLHNFRSWVGVDSYSFDKLKAEDETPEEDDDGGGGELATHIETLPLFPAPGGATTAAGGSHHDMFKMQESGSPEHSNGGYYSGGNWFSHSDGRTSLELSLNSSYGYYD